MINQTILGVYGGYINKKTTQQRVTFIAAMLVLFGATDAWAGEVTGVKLVLGRGVRGGRARTFPGDSQ